MLVTFKTPSHGNVTMFGSIAHTLIRMMGHDGGVPGTLNAEAVPEALAALNARLEAEADAPPPKTSAPAPSRSRYDDEEDGPAVSLATRAGPLKALLAAAIEAGDYVMWK